MSVPVVAAAAGGRIKQATTKLREVNLAGILVLDLEQAALAATIAERLPLVPRHRLEALSQPEGRGCYLKTVGRRSSFEVQDRGVYLRHRRRRLACTGVC